MVPLVTWGQETWQMINCHTCARVHTHVRERQVANQRKLAPEAREGVNILNMERVLKVQLKSKHPPN